MPITRSPRRHSPGDAYSHRMRRLRDHGLKPVIKYRDYATEEMPANVTLNCGWGRLVFAQTFEDSAHLAEILRQEGSGQRDIGIYIRDPHVVLAHGRQDLFLDPSHTYRLDLGTYRSSRKRPRGFFIRRLCSSEDAEAANRIYEACAMLPSPVDFYWSRRDSRQLVYFLAEDEQNGQILGVVTGVDHHHLFKDVERGCSLWCLAVDPQAQRPGIGEALVRRVAEHFQARGARYLDLSVLHDNAGAIQLYDKLGFKRVPYFSIKRKNPINETLFITQTPEEGLNPYAQLIVKQARRRGIGVDVVDAEGGFFRLHYGGRTILCRESLSELTSGTAVSICDDKAVTRRIVERAGVTVPAQIEIGADTQAAQAFLHQHGRIVVKPARGEQGRGIAVNLDDWPSVEAAIEVARNYCDRVLLEQFMEGDDLRLIVIDYRLVAAALRRPAQVTGDGVSTVCALIERQSRRRQAATGGESSIPLDAETERCVKAAGYALNDVLPADAALNVRKTANLHTGGTIHDVTDHVHPALVDAAIRAARAIEIPVTGIDFIVKSPREPGYIFIEANERPGLANHEPQPTAERFVDLLFPLSMPAAARAERWRSPKPAA